MRKHFILVELEAEDVSTADVVSMVQSGILSDMGPDTGKKRVTSLSGNRQLMHWKASNFDELMRQFLKWRSMTSADIGIQPGGDDV